jgi:NADPH-dependent glutamate synthase beta subunit-like oxidoreductase
LLTDSETLMTAQPGVFAAGDVATGPKSVNEGVAQGQRAAWAIDRHLRGLGPARYVPAWRRQPAPQGLDRLELDFANRTRATSELAVVGRENRNGEVSQGFREEIARAEAQRCLRCDVIASCQIVEVKRKVPV